MLTRCFVDHIFFTGSTHVGRIVAKAAAKQLTTVTLELGEYLFPFPHSLQNTPLCPEHTPTTLSAFPVPPSLSAFFVSPTRDNHSPDDPKTLLMTHTPS